MNDTIGSRTPYDIELKGSGEGWNGTLNRLIETLISDITDDGPCGPVEVTTDDGTVRTGTVDVWMGEGTFTITEADSLPIVIEIDDVVRVRA